MGSKSVGKKRTGKAEEAGPAQEVVRAYQATAITLLEQEVVKPADDGSNRKPVTKMIRQVANRVQNTLKNHWYWNCRELVEEGVEIPSLKVIQGDAARSYWPFGKQDYPEIVVGLLRYGRQEGGYAQGEVDRIYGWMAKGDLENRFFLPYLRKCSVTAQGDASVLARRFKAGELEEVERELKDLFKNMDIGS